MLTPHLPSCRHSWSLMECAAAGSHMCGTGGAQPPLGPAGWGPGPSVYVCLPAYNTHTHTQTPSSLSRGVMDNISLVPFPVPGLQSSWGSCSIYSRLGSGPLRATTLAHCLDTHTLPHLCARSTKLHIGHPGPGDQGFPRFLKPWGLACNRGTRRPRMHPRAPLAASRRSAAGAAPAASVRVPTLWPFWNLHRSLFHVYMTSAGQGHGEWGKGRG